MAVHLFKVTAFRLRRAVVDLASRPPRLRRLAGEGFDRLAAECITPLLSDLDPRERAHQRGKIQNLRVACRSLDGLAIPAGSVFSFWRHVGPPIARRGYVPGRMLREGCMVAAIGGGLCQLSNALFEIALQSGCRIVERHAHSRIVPGSAAAIGRDATVAWNYVDLRFVPDRDLLLSARLSRGHLCVRLLARAPDAAAPAPGLRPPASDPHAAAAPAPRSCASCGEIACHLHERTRRTDGIHAFLVDAAWPEFRHYVGSVRGREDWLGCPIEGGFGAGGRYDWDLAGFAGTAAAPVATLGRGLAQRMARARGAAAVRAAELLHTGRVARRLARVLTQDVETVTVAQSLLPFLWRDGHLGGRAVSVLMTSLPLEVLQSRLDAAAARHPDRATLTDFRAPRWLVEAESEALASCVHVVTPHAAIADLFGDRAMRLPWVAPAAGIGALIRDRGRIAFPGPTAARKGAYAVRDAARALDLEVIPQGGELEGPDFWSGVRVGAAHDWPTAGAMVLPAIVEHQPRRLLAALSLGVPVIASLACGIDPGPGLTVIPADDKDALIAALRAVLSDPAGPDGEIV